jgi:2-polyprenyl-3-methyl-5-hydroxy-6-metoxy-1,4-benzoquinol methylase
MITAETEREKYRKIWAVPAYRSNSPGEGLVSYFLKNAEWQKGQTLIDLGCGTGRAGLALSRKEFRVTLLDHCEEALDEAVRLEELPFIEANLWELDDHITDFDWFYCCDVMEHIPPERVDLVLHNCAQVARRGFFQIAMFDDSYGDRIGEKLHLTVKNGNWWMAALKEHFQVTEAHTPSYKRLVAFVEAS